MKITIAERPGKCRWCGCTELRGCGAGCSWANRSATLCSECVPLDRMIRTAAGRKQLAEAAATYDGEALAGPAPRRSMFTRGDRAKLQRAIARGRKPSVTFADGPITFADGAAITRAAAALRRRGRR